ncbi:MAG: putative metal-dependent hydrolase [Saprospiraceae bacterium]|nr:putative metal-dependent hydrolase [Saprospiraceae bacterium]
MEDLRFPIGKFKVPEKYTPASREGALDALRNLPNQLQDAISQLDATQWDTPYRPEGWTVRQVVHHLADSHMNSFIRFKWALSEDKPMIKPYDQAAWVEMNDARDLNPNISIDILRGVHARLVHLIEGFGEEEFAVTLGHPEWDRALSLDFMLALYGWHSRHHLRHITALMEREGWA